METLFGFVLAFATIFFIKRFVLTEALLDKNKTVKVIYRQSHIFSLIAPSLPYMPIQIPFKPTQSYLNEEKNRQRTIFTEDKAYWIKDNAFYQASLLDGEIDTSTIKVVDTMTMDKVELDKMIFIVQKLTEGTRNDFGNPGIG
jgi:predicted ATP-dependent endonuclease of OLD family